MAVVHPHYFTRYIMYGILTKIWRLEILMQCKKWIFSFIELNNREETLGHDIFVRRSIPSENQCQLALNY